MLSPILFVGVGGSGGNTVRAIRSTLLRRLHAIGWEGDIPEAFQTLWIDTISTQGKGGFNAPILPAEQYLGLVANGVS
jgi:cell division GTPase FtsZ